MRVAVAGVHDAETRLRQARVEPRAVRTVAVDVEPQRREPTGRVGRDLPEAGQLREGDGVRAVAEVVRRPRGVRQRASEAGQGAARLALCESALDRRRTRTHRRILAGAFFQTRTSLGGVRYAFQAISARGPS